MIIYDIHIFSVMLINNHDNQDFKTPCHVNNLGRNWRWTPETKDSTYCNILRRFEDRRAAPFSIHQIALMGASEGKDVGQWFGPNTIAQVLK